MSEEIKVMIEDAVRKLETLRPSSSSSIAMPLSLTVMACGARSFASGPIVSGACVSSGTDSTGSVAVVSSGCTAAVSSVPAVSARTGSCMPVKISSAESAPHRIRFIG